MGASTYTLKPSSMCVTSHFATNCVEMFQVLLATMAILFGRIQSRYFLYISNQVSNLRFGSIMWSFCVSLLGIMGYLNKTPLPHVYTSTVCLSYPRLQAQFFWDFYHPSPVWRCRLRGIVNFEGRRYLRIEYLQCLDFADKKCRYRGTSLRNGMPQCKIIVIGCYAQLEKKKFRLLFPVSTDPWVLPKNSTS